jgi:hypothetical protein
LEKAFEFMYEKHACNPDYITMEILTEWLSAVGETEKLKNFVGGYDVFHSAARKASARTWTLHTCKFAVFVRDQEALQFPVSTVSPSRL